MALLPVPKSSPYTFSALSVEPYGGPRVLALGNMRCSSSFSALSVEPYGGPRMPAPSVGAHCSTFSALSVEPYGGPPQDIAVGCMLKLSFSALSVEPYGGPSCCRRCRTRRRSSFSALSVEPYGGPPGVLVVFYAINDLKALFEASQGRLRPLFCWNFAMRQLSQRQFSQYGNCGKSLPVCEGGFLSFFSGHSAVAR